MTTQTPHDRYPTAPPWASAAEEPPHQQRVRQDPAHEQHACEQETWAGVPYTPHGQLMVAHPELVHGAGRPAPPSSLPTAVLTILFGPLGAISAARRAKKARRQGNPRSPYWLTFGVTLGVYTLLMAVAVSAAIPLFLTYQENAATAAVESNVVNGGKIRTSAGVTVKSATCSPTSVRAASGLRPYTCRVTLSSGVTGTLHVTANRGGIWSKVKGG
jgi:hypothetical protein